MPDVFAMFLLGLWAARRRLLQEPANNHFLLSSLLAAGFVLGSLGNGLQLTVGAVPDAGLMPALANNASRLVGGLGFGLFYMAGIAMLFNVGSLARYLALFAWPGRMALTNYLFQWALCAWIFYGYGLGLYQSVGPVFGIPVGVCICGAQMILSRKWLEHFRFGPAEWLWRRASYWN
jgi:uncharacterized protein